MLTELETRNRKAALESFVRAVFNGQEPESLLALSIAAGLSASEADQLAARMAKAREQLAQANLLPRLRKDAAAAQERLEKIQAKATAETARMEAQVEEATIVASMVRRAVYAAEDCARQLLELHDEGLLLAAMPKEVARLIDRRNAEAKSRLAHQAMRNAVDERDRRRNAVRNAEDALQNMPIVTALEYERCKGRFKDRLTEAQRRLEEAESALTKAEAAAEAARKAIPAHP